MCSQCRTSLVSFRLFISLSEFPTNFFSTKPNRKRQMTYHLSHDVDGQSTHTDTHTDTHRHTHSHTHTQKIGPEAFPSPSLRGGIFVKSKHSQDTVTLSIIESSQLLGSLTLWSLLFVILTVPWPQQMVDGVHSYLQRVLGFLNWLWNSDHVWEETLKEP